MKSRVGKKSEAVEHSAIVELFRVTDQELAISCLAPEIQFKISCNFAASEVRSINHFVFFHAGMRLDDLVEVESRANLDVPCDSWGLTDQFLRGVP